jgi:hypothetical protein
MTKRGLGTGDTVIVAVLVVLAGLAIAFGSSEKEEQGGETAATAVAGKVDTIAKRVEKVRGLSFDEIPKPDVVTPDETRAEILDQIDREYPRKRQEADTELLELLGLVPPGTDLREIYSDLGGEQIAGYYDPKRERLAVVDGPSASGVVAEITLAHELTHALEDQRFGIEDDPGAGADDHQTAYTALIEGTATAAMTDYSERYISPTAALLDGLAAIGPAMESTESIPPYVQRALEFSYTGGAEFVAALRDEGGWKVVNRALADRPPVSTEQVMHPVKYFAREGPSGVRIGPLGLGADWKRSARGTIGEYDTRELLRLGDEDGAAAAAGGWGDGRYELWRNEAEATDECGDPCRAANVLVLRWAWDAPADAREFDAALLSYMLEGLEATPAGPLRWSGGGGGAAIAVNPRGAGETTLVFAPSPKQAARLAESVGGERGAARPERPPRDE